MMVNDKRENRMYVVRTLASIFRIRNKFKESVLLLKKICGRNGIDKTKCRFLSYDSMIMVEFFFQNAIFSFFFKFFYCSFSLRVYPQIY